MTKFGETNNFQASDFIRTLQEFASRKIDVAIVNSRMPDKRLLELYRGQKADFVGIGVPDPDCHLIQEDLLDTSGDIIRHDPKKTGSGDREGYLRLHQRR